MSKELNIRKECCDIWNNLKDKTKMIDYLIESKRQISDLETKLAERDAEIEKVEKTYMKQRDYYTKEFNEVIDNLKQQLAEKDQSIENWETMYESVMQTCNNDIKEIKMLNKQLAEKEKEFEWLHQKFAKHIEKEQDKISFAVEQLEKVKAFIPKCSGMDMIIMVDDTHSLNDIIDNQIKQLKEGKHLC